MLDRGDFVTPRLNGGLYFEKPPLYYWLNAAALSLPGRPEVVCRLFSALFGLAESLDREGKADEAARARGAFKKAWARADVTLRVEDL